MSLGVPKVLIIVYKAPLPLSITPCPKEKPNRLPREPPRRSRFRVRRDTGRRRPGATGGSAERGRAPGRSAQTTPVLTGRNYLSGSCERPIRLAPSNLSTTEKEDGHAVYR
jgi:hypothetical protein